MTRECHDPRYEAMIHAHELGILEDSERLAFEAHLIECDSCFARVSESKDAIRLLRSDEALKAIAIESAQLDDIAETKVTDIRDRSTGFRNAPWGRIAAVAAVLALVAIPLFQSTGPDDPLQQLVFSTTRQSTAATIDLKQGGQVEFEFPFAADPDGSRGILTIASASGSIVFIDSTFIDPDQDGTGTHRLPVDSFDAGMYSLTVSSTDGNGSPKPLEFYFRVK